MSIIAADRRFRHGDDDIAPHIESDKRWRKGLYWKQALFATIPGLPPAGFYIPPELALPACGTISCGVSAVSSPCLYRRRRYELHIPIR